MGDVEWEWDDSICGRMPNSNDTDAAYADGYSIGTQYAQAARSRPTGHAQLTKIAYSRGYGYAAAVWTDAFNHAIIDFSS